MKYIINGLTSLRASPLLRSARNDALLKFCANSRKSVIARRYDEAIYILLKK